jgi:hypothetical protein
MEADKGRSGAEAIVVGLDALSTNKTAYKLDTECTICKNSSWTVFNPKKYCKFCYRAVCKSCSGQTLLHPERHTQERCCTDCSRRFLSQGVIDQFQAHMQEKLATLKEASEKLAAEKAEKQRKEREVAECRKGAELLERRIEEGQRKQEIEEKGLAEAEELLQIEVKRLEVELNTLKCSLTSLETQQQANESALSTEQAASSFYSDKLSKAKSDLSCSQDEFDRLRRMLDQRQVSSDVPVKATDHAKVTELQGIIQQLREQQAALGLQNEALEKEMEREEGRENAASEDEQLFAQYCELRQEQERLKREEERTGETDYRAREIEKLQRDLEKLQAENDDLQVLMRKQQASVRRGR